MRRIHAAVALALALAACRNVKEFSTRGDDRFEGGVVKGDFVRAGVPEDSKICLHIDTERLADAPGEITSSDGRFKQTPLRPVPQFFHDPLSTLTFGEGRVRNLVYAVSTSDGQDAFAVVSLMESDAVEIRLLRGAPGGPDAGPPPVFAVFILKREKGAACSF